MNLKELIENFDFKNPDRSLLPECFPNCDLGEFNTAEVGKFLSIKTTKNI